MSLFTELFRQKKGSPFVIVLTLWLLINSLQAQAYMNEQKFDCTLSLPSPQRIEQGILLEFNIQNNTEKDILLLSWYTPFEGFLSNLFIITDNTGKKLNYKGAMVKRFSPEPEDYIKLTSKEKFSIQLDLTQAYQFSKGTFSLQLKQQNIQYKYQNSELMNFSCNIEKVSVQID